MILVRWGAACDWDEVERDFVEKRSVVCEGREWRWNGADGYCSLNAPTEVVKQIIVNIEAGVEVEVTIAA